jgi:uncharacterized protein (TIGR00730 family)
MEHENPTPATNAFEQINEEGGLIPPELPLGIEYFVQQIKETADKLIRDRASRGDAKLLNTALKEMRYGFKLFSAYRGRPKITIFGSARLPLDHPACKQAIDFGRRMAEEGYMVITGAAQGIMEAGHVGAGRDDSIGINILLPFESEANTIIADDPKLINLKYFFTRKLLFIKESDAIALFPGGFGTLDEGFEALTLVQTGKSHLFPIILVDEPGGDYWHRWLQFVKEVLHDRGLISPADMALFKLTDSVDEAVREVVTFYKVYHSMRFVGKDLVLRLKKPLAAPLLDRINAEYKDLLKSGSFELTPALEAEANETHIATLPRLVFHFDRHNLGGLRMLIDLINQGCP